MKIYYKKTETQYFSFKEASVATGILGLNAKNCGDYGFVIPTDEPRPEITATQKATKADKPTENSDGSWSFKWVVTDKTVEELTQDHESTILQIKSEANRRITALCPEWKQRNLLAQATQLVNKGELNWTQEERAAWSAGEALWVQISRIRDASNTLEAMNPIPENFTDDIYWNV